MAELKPFRRRDVGGDAVPLKILHVDDNPINRRVLTEMLGLMGHVVLQADSPIRAVELAGVGRFDVILMDIHMPEMGGVEALRLIRSLPGPAQDVPIIAVTADVSAYDDARCRELGFAGMLEKPLSMKALRDGLEEASSAPTIPRVARR